MSADILGTYYDQNGNAREYFTGTEFVRVDANINFNFGGQSPIAGVGRDDFTIHWIGEVEIPTSGDYTFGTRSDDGVRLWVNGNQLVDNWTDHSPTLDFGALAGLVGGQRYTIQMDYYERGGGARAELYWDGPGFSREIIPSTALFIDNTPPTVSSVSSPCFDGTISVVFSEKVTQASAENLTNYSANGGIVLASATLQANETTVILEYFSGDGTAFDLSINNVSDLQNASMVSTQTLNVTGDANGLFASYYDQNNISGQYFTGNIVEQTDANVDFDWATGIPTTGIADDFFSVRWEGELEVPSDGAYIFYTVSDDGVRLDLDGNQIINNWTNHAAETDTSAVQNLVAGQRYPIVMEFYENAVLAEARLQWQGPGFSREAIPTQNLFFSCNSVAPPAIGQWQLDEASWTGANNEIIDTSGNDLHGRAINLDALPNTGRSNPALPSNPGTCGYGDFDGLNDGYLQIDDPGTNSILDLDTAFTVSTWIYPTSYPAAGDLATMVSKDTNYEFHIDENGQIFWWWGGGSQELTSAATLTLNHWAHISITYRSGQQAIYINGVGDATNTSNTALSTNNDPLLIGTDLALPNRRFVGLIDEVNLFDTDLTALQIQEVMQQTRPCVIPNIDHYAINHSGTGITCEAENIQITAHDASHVETDSAGITIRVNTTSSTGGWLASDSNWTLMSGTGNLVSTGDGEVEYTFATGESSVELALANISLAAIDIDVVDTGDSSVTDDEGSSEDALLSFSDTALRFYNDANGDGNADGNDPIAGPLTAGTNSSLYILKAIETNTDTGTCQARLLGLQSVNLAYECRDPQNCVRDQDMLFNSGAIQENNLNTINDYNALDLTFDAEGEVSFNISYQDAGQVRLHANLSLAASGEDPAVTLSGSSADLISRPAELFISRIETLAGDANPGTTNSGDNFVNAGSAFLVEVEARNSAGGLTPNFGRETSPEAITLNTQSLVFPGGATFPALNSPAAFSPGAALGQFENSALSWPEAGSLTINASISDGDYLGSGDISGTTSATIGRFSPAYLQLDSHSIIPGCVTGNFSYMSGQAISYRPMSMNYSISAQGNGTGTLDNVDTIWGYPNLTLSAQAEEDNNGTNVANRSFVPSGTWVRGEYIVTANGGFARALDGSNEVADGPFDSLQFGLMADSNIDSADFQTASLNMNATSSTDCVSDTNCNAIHIGSTQALRFARLFGQNAHGPETAALPVPLRVEYWNGNQFITSDVDSCSVIDAADIRVNSQAISTDSNRTVALVDGSTTGSFANLAAGVSITMSGGESGLSFSPPGFENFGSFPVDIDLTNTPWLRYDWNQDGDSANDTSLPSLEIYFGRYRGHDRVIFWREVLE